MINLVLLKTFLTVAKTGSFRKAAEEVFLTQPAVSQQIHQLEEALGCRLFERQNKKTHLTSPGQEFLPCAVAILKQYEEAKMKMSEMNHRYEGVIRIATIYSIGMYLLEPLVRQYLKKYPTVKFNVEYHPSDKIYDMVFNRTVDFGLVAYPEKRYGVMTEIFDEDELVLAQSPHYRVIKKKIGSTADLHQVKFVAYAIGSPTRKATDHFFKKAGIYPAIANEYDNINTLKSAVGLGMGCSLVPRNTIQQELNSRTLEIVPMPKVRLKRTLGVLYPKGKVLTKLPHAFYEMIMKGHGTLRPHPE